MTLCVFALIFNWEKASTPPKGSELLEKLRRSHTVMWIGAHPDDELYTAGTFGYFTRDLHGHLVIVSLYYNPDYMEDNKKSAQFLGNAEYIWIQKELYERGKKVNVRCHSWDQIDDVVEELEDSGVKDLVEELILKYRPDVVFTFEPTNGFRHSCQHASIARVVDDAVKELRSKGYTFFDYYYVLNRDPNLFGEKNMDPPPVTDVVELNEDMWGYKLSVFKIYSDHYPVLGNEMFTSKLQHKEWFREVLPSTDHSKSVERTTIYYGPDERNFFDLYYQGSDRTAIIVHGGGFVIGSARGGNARTLINYFLSHGYNVVSIEYRTCTTTSFDNVLEDICKGITRAVKEVSSRRPQAQFVYVGFSAGSTAAALLLTSNQTACELSSIKNYILLSGVYNPDNSRSVAAGKTMSTCRTRILQFFDYGKRPSPDIRVLIVEGKSDRYDLHPMTNESNAEFLKAKLEGLGVQNVEVIWVDGGHKAPVYLFSGDGDPRIASFLGMLRAPS